MSTKPFEYSFNAVVERSETGSEAAFVSMPLNIEKRLKKGQLKVNASFDGHSYRGVLANMGTGCHILGIRKDIRKAIGKSIGDRVRVTIQEDHEERTVEVPTELTSAFRMNASIEAFFNSLSFTNRKEYSVWITSAKKQETKMKRLIQTIQKLSEGRKNPTAK